MSHYKPYTGPAAGWGALVSVTKSWLGSRNAVANIKAMLKTNQDHGLDCPGCAWGETPEKGMIKFCENGAKAVNWEATGRRVDPAFFEKHAVAELLTHDDYWLESQGRITHPMRYDAKSDRYKPITWPAAFEIVASHLKAMNSPDEAEFYTSGRASNEAAFLYQLFVRALGTNNFPDCSNMCHEASGIGMSESIGVGKGTVRFEDFAKADAIFVIGQNPGTNHPRMLEPLREAVHRGAQVICFNPLKERGLERFQHPQSPLEMLKNDSEPTNTAYFRPALGGDMAAIRGMAKFLWQWEQASLKNNTPAVFDREFIATHTHGIDDYLEQLDNTSWQHIESQSGLSLAEIEMAANMYRKADSVIMCWAMGVTQHVHSVATIQEIISLQLLRGNVGKPGAGLSPVRGHSNVQGDRTMGIDEQPPKQLLDALEARFKFNVPRAHGHTTVKAIEAMEHGKTKVFVGLGGNFVQAAPDTPRTHAAMQNCDLTVQISTKLNRSHLITGKDALILPCLGRTEMDAQQSGKQGVTVEDTFSMVHISYGQLKPFSPLLKSESAIIAGIAHATLGNHPVDWQWLIADYDRIRQLIAETIPGFTDFNNKIANPGGFYLGNPAAERQWLTESGKAQFMKHALPESLIHPELTAADQQPDLILQTMRSHDQYNTTVYSLNDRYRGVYGMRDVIFINEADLKRLGIEHGEKVDIVSLWHDGKTRRVSGFTALSFDVPAGQAAAYYPETNPLVPLESYGDRTFTPTSKFVAIRLEKRTAQTAA
ncbi:Putative formate dehydrogenase oxidoreductase protein [Methylophaga frappieri]|uniref:Putative formate dehydrogenase oxidoreductase protein n=1 Tax=Methylophaga frappieri (strain ATCC BAA-2434 / DSM 25690 / JAM7) TaxID=754477 RepID=I1YFF3_METFJ|nr:FdhF/YdeP family oxidoreductase [Methylophaga frappieri]AFJ01646.1 Putative formate dehydrogenase oxidoreductase protein [Methylophaga frappieri]